MFPFTLETCTLMQERPGWFVLWVVAASFFVLGCGAARIARSLRAIPASGSLCLLVSVAVAKTLLTKMIFERISAPVALSIASCVVTGILLLPILLWQKKLTLLRWRQVPSFASVCVAVAADMACTNVGLSILPIAFHQSIKATLPAATIAVDFVVNRNEQPLSVILVVIGICAGPIVMSIDKDWTSSISNLSFGVIAMLAAVIFGALKYVIAHKMIKRYKNEMGVLGFTFWMEVFSTLLLFPWAIVNGEMAMLVLTPRSFDQWLMLVGISAFGGVRVISQFLFLSDTSPTSLATSNIVIQTALAVIGSVVFDNAWSYSLVIGTLITAVMSTVYAYLNIEHEYQKVMLMPVERSEAQTRT